MTIKRNIFNYSKRQFSYEANVKRYDLQLVDRLRNNDNLNNSELASAARVITKYNINEETVWKNLEKHSIQASNTADELELRKLISVFVENKRGSAELYHSLRSAYTRTHPEQVTMNTMELPAPMRFYVWLYNQRRHFICLMGALGFKMK